MMINHLPESVKTHPFFQEAQTQFHKGVNFAQKKKNDIKKDLNSILNIPWQYWLLFPFTIFGTIRDWFVYGVILVFYLKSTIENTETFQQNEKLNQMKEKAEDFVDNLKTRGEALSEIIHEQYDNFKTKIINASSSISTEAPEKIATQETKIQEQIQNTQDNLKEGVQSAEKFFDKNLVMDIWNLMYIVVTSIISIFFIFPILLILPITHLHCLGKRFFRLKELDNDTYIGQFGLTTTSTSSDKKKKNEKWFYVGGFLATEQTAAINARRLQQLFNRKITPFYVPTHGFFADLLECVMCSSFEEWATEASLDLSERLKQEKRQQNIILMCHSQGALIVTKALEHLNAENEKELLNKIEVYTFGAVGVANRASESKQLSLVHHVEHFANKYDIVAQVGVIHQFYKSTTYPYGDVFIAESKYGHTLNFHYLRGDQPLNDYICMDHTSHKKTINRESKLFSYMH